MFSCMKKNSPIILQLILYITQYIFIPQFIDIYPSDVHMHLIIICSTTFLIAVVGMMCFSDCFRKWLLGWLIYTVLVYIYHPTYIYGIGYGILTKTLSVLGWSVIIFMLESIIWMIIKFAKHIFYSIK